MIKLTNLADYSVILMCEIARIQEKRSAQELASLSGLPVPTVSKILNTLARANLLKSHRGLKGGFALALPADEISVADIIEALDGPISLTHCTDTANRCNVDDICHMRPHWHLINDSVRSALDGVKLSQILPSATASPFLTRAPQTVKTAQA